MFIFHHCDQCFSYFLLHTDANKFTKIPGSNTGLTNCPLKIITATITTKSWFTRIALSFARSMATCSYTYVADKAHNCFYENFTKLIFRPFSRFLRNVLSNMPTMQATNNDVWIQLWYFSYKFTHSEDN